MRWGRTFSADRIRRAASGGFTLIEVIVALGILAFVLLAIAQLFSVAWGLQNTSGRQVQMLSFGQERLERLMALSLANVPPALGNLTLPAPCRVRVPDLTCWNSVDDDHRWPTTANAADMRFCNCFIVWEVCNASTGGCAACVAGQPCIIRLYVFPYPPAVTLRPQVLIGYVQ